MNMKEFMRPIYDRERNVQDRLFMLVSAVALAALFALFIVEIIKGTRPQDLAITGGGLAFLIIVISLAIRFYKYKIGAIVVCTCMGFVLFPCAFFLAGGIYGGALIWFINYLLYVSLVLSGKQRLFFLVSAVVVVGVCFYVSYNMPDLLVERTRDQLYQTSLISLILVGAMVVLMVDFGIRVFQDENKRSKEQAKKISELKDAQNHFFSSMSHEIRTPINTIIGLNEMILRDSSNEEVREDAENIQSASEVLLQAVNDILDMSKFESGQMELSLAPYRTDEMISDVVNMLWIRAKEKGLDFRVDVSPEIPESLLGDEMRIKQILINVLNNAIKYTAEGSVTLQVQYERIGDNVAKMVYAVSDTGIGIKKENIPNLFEAFKRVDQKETRNIEGAGLGLSIVKRFVEMMDGTVSVNSVYTKGSTFVVEIPQTIISEKPIGEISAGARRCAGESESYHQRFEAPAAKVLVVDDTPANLLVVKKLLRDTKVQMTLVGSGSEALEKTLDSEFHVIFMDHMMPEMDGIECLHHIRTQPGGHCAEAKIIALTANAGSDLKSVYAKEGFDGYLVKPVSGSDLERELYHALPRELVYETAGGAMVLEESTSWISEHQKKVAVAITTESVADLPQAFLDHFGIAVIPHLVSTEDGLFRDGVDLDTRGLLEHMNAGGAVMDCAPDIEAYENFFAQALQTANNVIHLSITSTVEHSGCNVAREAARAFENVVVVDSGHLSSGQGIMTLLACRMAKDGYSVSEILERLDQARRLVSTSFIVDNIDYLARARQIGTGVAYAAKVFMIHPVIVVKRGRMKVKNVYFGALETAWEYYVNAALRKPGRIDKRTLFITYVGLSYRELEHIQSLVEKRVKFEHVYFQEASPAIAVNCGPKTFGLLFMYQWPE